MASTTIIGSSHRYLRAYTKSNRNIIKSWKKIISSPQNKDKANDCLQILNGRRKSNIAALSSGITLDINGTRSSHFATCDLFDAESQTDDLQYHLLSQQITPQKRYFSTSSSAISEEESIKNDKNEKKDLLRDEEFNPHKVRSEILKASQWNQGSSDNKWDPQFCSNAIENYESHLRYIQYQLQQQKSNTKGQLSINESYETLLSSHTTERALKTMIKTKLPTPLLSKRVRSLEKLIGSIGLTPLTDRLSLRLLEVNGKAGNVGRSINLLRLRKARGYNPIELEFRHAVMSIHSAGLKLRRGGGRNVFLSEKDNFGEHQQHALENPTRWLDEILLNMSSRGVDLNIKVANLMLECYACTGRSPKAVHFFYKIRQEAVGEEQPSSDGADSLEPQQREDRRDDTYNLQGDETSLHHIRKSRVRMAMRRHMPPYYKIPNDVKLNGKIVKKPGKKGVKLSKLEWEKEEDWSHSLAAAFAFTFSLTYGACGHEAINLNLNSWNILIKACCYRGAIWRAVEILQETMPKNGIEPDAFSYNTILAAVARLGDNNFQKEFLTTMTNKGLQVDKYTVQALADGHLNAGDISGAITLVQDMFNQHQILPPYTTHLKIIEFALGNNLIYEAKRQVYFLQQLWKWELRGGVGVGGENSNKNDGEVYQSQNLEHVIYLTKKNPKLSKKSLQRLFAYFGEELTDEDFF